MRAHAVLIVGLDVGGRSVVRELRSEAPLSLVPRRGTAAAGAGPVTVHLVSSASTPLGGDEVELDVRVGHGAALVLTGVTAAVALPGAGGPSSVHLRFAVEAGASLQYLPEPVVVAARADHRTRLDVELHPTARLRVREMLVAGRSGEPSGRYRGTVRITEATGSDVPAGSTDPRTGAVSRFGDLSSGAPGPGVGRSNTTGRGDPSRSTLSWIGASRSSTPVRVLLAQTQELGVPFLQDSAAYLAGRRVLASEVLVWGEDPREAVSGEWWSLVPLARRGSLATAVARDAVTARRELSGAVAAHPGWSGEVLGGVPADPARAGDSHPARPGLPSPQCGCDTRCVAHSQPKEPAHGRATSSSSEAR